MKFRNLPLWLALPLSVLGCSDFLTSGDTVRDPNRPSNGSIVQYFIGVQSNLWATHTGHLSRVTSAWAQQMIGAGDGYETYNISQTTNGFHASLYATGALVDIRKIQQDARELSDTLFLGIAQVQEAMLMGIGADVFGDLVYSKALGPVHPPLDRALDVYDSIQSILAQAKTNLAKPGVGPGAADLVYQSNRTKWIALANTLKARYFMHTVEMRPMAYDSAMKYAEDGIQSASDDYKPVFSGAPGERSLWAQFLISRPTLRPAHVLDSILKQRGDRRRSDYFQIDGDGDAIALSAVRRGNQYGQPIATALENRLIWAEAAFRKTTPDMNEARTRLNEARDLVGLLPVSSSLSGQALLSEILVEKYIATFQLGVEAWMDYRRTCSPNLAPTVAGGKIPGRLYYDTNEQQTNSGNIPQPGTDPNGLRKGTDKVNPTSDLSNTACLAGA